MTFRWKADGLDAEGLQTRSFASSLTLGGPLKHLAVVEDYLFTTKLRGESIGGPWDTTGLTGDDDWEFSSAADDPPEALRTRSTTARSSVPGQGWARRWSTAVSSSRSTQLTVTATTPICAGSSAT